MNAQSIMVDARIVDAETHESLPNATICVDADRNYIANMEGDFCVEVEQQEVLTVSYVGYKPVHIKAENVKSVIMLSPYAVELNDVQVLPLKNILEKITSRIKTEIAIHKREESNFYYRQTTQNNGECCEYIEAILNGYSEVALRQPSVVTGRYGALKITDTKKYSYVGNYYDMSCLSPYAPHKPKKKSIILPMMPDSEKLYQVDYDILSDKANNNTIYKIAFSPRSKVKSAIIKGVIYVDADSYKILKYEGEVLNDNVINVSNERFPLKQSFLVTYTYNRGFMEVQSVATKASYLQHDISVAVNSTLMNVGKKYHNGKKKLKWDSNLKNKISSAGYDSKFWKDNTIIKRTPMEEQVVRMFEKDNVFSNMTE